MTDKGLIFGGLTFITILLHFHYFGSLETAITQKKVSFKNFTTCVSSL